MGKNEPKKYYEYTTKDDEFLRLMLHDTKGEKITIKTACRRALLAEGQTYLPENVGIHFSNLIRDIVEEKQSEGQDIDFVRTSFDQLLQSHFDDLVANNFENFQNMGVVPARNHRLSIHAAIVDYAREMSIVANDGNRYSIGDATGVDILKDKIDMYNRLSLNVGELPEVVAEYFDNDKICNKDREM